MSPKIDGIELWLLYIAVHLKVIYLYVKSESTSFYTLEFMPQTEFKVKNLQRALTTKTDGIELCTLHLSLL